MRITGCTCYLFFWSFKAATTLFCTFWGTILIKLWDIQIGGWVKCVGLPRIEKHPAARIHLGKGCCLRSARCSNVAGINRPVTLAARHQGVLEIGDHCGISSSILVADEAIRIGNRVQIGVNCAIFDTDFHPLDVGARMAGAGGNTAPVVIEDDVWLCMNVTVLKGVTIGRGSVVAVGSVVVSDIPPGVLAGGIPAGIVKRLTD